MTERIDLDELDAGDSEEEAEGPNAGDWFWREEGDPSDEPEPVADASTENDSAAPHSASAEGVTAGEADAETADEERANAETTGSERSKSEPMPRVPRENDDKPVGVPTESGGAGGGPGDGSRSTAGERDGVTDASGRAGDSAGGPSTDQVTEASGPHGGGLDDMTLAFTYEAATRLADFGRVAADAYDWADWVGIVGRVPAHVVNKFQRDRNVDLDFFNGASTDPGERLARIGPSSMFYAERMVVVGVEGTDEEIAETADWEFVPLSEAAGKAGWDVAE